MLPASGPHAEQPALPLSRQTLAGGGASRVSVLCVDTAGAADDSSPDDPAAALHAGGRPGCRHARRTVSLVYRTRSARHLGRAHRTHWWGAHRDCFGHHPVDHRLLAKVPIIWTVGIIVLIIGAVLAIVGGAATRSAAANTGTDPTGQIGRSGQVEVRRNRELSARSTNLIKEHAMSEVFEVLGAATVGWSSCWTGCRP